jgi:MerR family transcriptional regulator, light-induced transcriptional regulator
MAVFYPIGAVAKLTGLTVDTLRAWERRYNAVTPARGQRGREYGEAEIKRLRMLRGAVERGHSIGQIAHLADAELQELDRAALASGGTPFSAAEAGPVRLEPLLDSLAAYDYAATNEELGRLALLLPARDLVHKVVLPLMRTAGEKWEHGEFQIAQEHMLSASVRNLLGGLLRLQRTNGAAPRLLFTTPAGELHEFGVLAAAMLAVANDCEVAYLGPNLPAAEIVLAARKSEPRVVVLGVLELNVNDAVRADVEALAKGLPKATELWLGGSGAELALAGRQRSNTFVIRDLNEFERHLTKVKGS